MKNTLAGKNVILTGASRGLGACIARTMWQHGASLLLTARSETPLAELCRELAANADDGQRAHMVVADLAIADGVDRLMAAAHDAWDRIDVLVNNAGMLGPIGPVWKNAPAEWETTIRVNLLAPVALCRACLPGMIERRRGKIVNLSGGGATGPRLSFSAYGAAKAALVRFSETLSQEVRNFNIQVNCIAPGAMNTQMLQLVLDAGPQSVPEAEYQRALKQAEEGGTSAQRAADLCIFLASSVSDEITGKLISAIWDPWDTLADHSDDLKSSDIYTLRRIVPAERGKDWG
jgi:NAD(P)-dependent dehydrogenase (short-subunit alcohol dehydrogenase family)